MSQPKWSRGSAAVGVFIHKGGNLRFALNKTARHEMGYPRAVTIDYDKKTQVLSFSPCDYSHPDGFVVSVWGQIHGTSLIKRYGLKPQRDIPLVRKSSDVWEATLEQK